MISCARWRWCGGIEVFKTPRGGGHKTSQRGFVVTFLSGSSSIDFLYVGNAAKQKEEMPARCLKFFLPVRRSVVWQSNEFVNEAGRLWTRTKRWETLT